MKPFRSLGKIVLLLAAAGAPLPALATGGASSCDPLPAAEWGSKCATKEGRARIEGLLPEVRRLRPFADLDTAKQDIGSDRRQVVFGPKEALGHGHDLSIDVTETKQHVDASDQPQRRDEPEAREEQLLQRGPGHEPADSVADSGKNACQRPG